jgi:hypothetical protein
LFGALLAPAILAGGLLAGEIRGFEAGGEVAASVMGQGTGLVLEPVLVPAPVRVVPEAPRSVVSAAPSPEPPVVVEEEPVTPAPVRTRAGCPGEWEDTWLWELCREQEEQRAGGSWVPGI